MNGIATGIEKLKQLTSTTVDCEGCLKLATLWQKRFTSRDAICLAANGGYNIDTASRVMAVEKSKLVLHLDVNGTIIAADPASGQDLRMVVNTFLAGACWGKDVAGKC